MNPRIRYSIASIVLLGLAAFAFLITRDPRAAANANDSNVPTAETVHAPRFTSSQQCKDCHAEVFEEWMGSHHQIAYLNPEVRKLSDDFRNKECQACHLPRPIIETGLLERTLPRISRPDEGVDCLTCHLGPGGRIVGLNDSMQGCMPVRDPKFMSVELCQTCHNQHQTTDQWRASKWAEQNVSCRDCHMLPTQRADGRRGRGHVFPAAHDLDMLKRAGDFRMKVEGGNVILELENVYAGHNFPTEERHRAVDIQVRFQDAAGTFSEWTRVFRFRQPYRDEPGENTQLPSGATHRSDVSIPAGSKRVEARLWYRLNPYAVDGDAASSLLHERAEDLK